MELLHQRSIIPYKVIYLNVTDDEIMKRGAVDRKSPTKYVHFRIQTEPRWDPKKTGQKN